MEVTKYIEYKHSAEKEFSIIEEKEAQEKLSSNMRDKIIISANIQLIKQIPFLFNNFSRPFLRSLALKLNKETYFNNELIFEEDDHYATHIKKLYNPNIPNYLIPPMFTLHHQSSLR